MRSGRGPPGITAGCAATRASAGVVQSPAVVLCQCLDPPLHDPPCRRAGRDPAAASAAYPLEGARATAVTGEAVVVRRAPDLASLRAELQRVLDAGIRSVAVVLKHAAIYPAHELAVGDLALEMGFTQVGWGAGGEGGGLVLCRAGARGAKEGPDGAATTTTTTHTRNACMRPAVQVSLSAVVMPMVKLVPRGFTAAADAYLTPHILRCVRARVPVAPASHNTHACTSRMCSPCPLAPSPPPPPPARAGTSRPFSRGLTLGWRASPCISCNQTAA